MFIGGCLVSSLVRYLEERGISICNALSLQEMGLLGTLFKTNVK